MADFIETEEERKRRIAEAEAEMRKAEDEVLLKANPEKFWAARDKAAREAKWEQDFGGPDFAQKDQARSASLAAKNQAASQVPFRPVWSPSGTGITPPANPIQPAPQNDRAVEFGNAQATFNRMTKQEGIHPLDALVKSGLYQFRNQRPPSQFEQAQMQRWNTPPPPKVVSSGGTIYRVGPEGAVPLTPPKVKPVSVDETPEMQEALRIGVDRISKGEKPSAVVKDYPNLISSPTWKSYISREVSAAFRPKSEAELMGFGAGTNAPPPNQTPNAPATAPPVAPPVVTPPTSSPMPEPKPVSSKRVRVVGPNGRRGTMPEGSPLPEGWRLE